MYVCVHILIGIEPGETTGEEASEESGCSLGDKQAVSQRVTFLVWTPICDLWSLVYVVGLKFNCAGIAR